MDRWETWQSWGADAWVVQVLRFGYRVPFLFRPPLSSIPLPLPSYSPSSIRGLALVDAVSDLVAKEAIEPAPPMPGYYSHLFVTPKVTGGWRPVIDLSRLNGFVDVSHFHMETNTIRSPISQGRGLDGVSGSPRRLPPGSGTSIFSLVPEVLRGGIGFPVSHPLL